MLAPETRGDTTTAAAPRKAGSSLVARFPAKTHAAPRDGAGAHPRDLVRLAAHEEELGLRHEGGRVDEQLHALVALEVAGVQDHGAIVEGERRRERRDVGGGCGGGEERRVLDLEHAARAAPARARLR